MAGKLKQAQYSLVLAVFLAFFLGVAGGWYVGQKRTSFPSTILPSSLSAKPLSETEPNDSPDRATPLSPGTPVLGTLNTGKDIDFYKVVIDAPARIRVNLSRLPQEYQLYVYNPNKQVIGVSQRRGFLDTSSTFSAPEKGTYYLKIFTNYQEAASLPYMITAMVLPFTE